MAEEEPAAAAAVHAPAAAGAEETPPASGTEPAVKAEPEAAEPEAAAETPAAAVDAAADDAVVDEAATSAAAPAAAGGDDDAEAAEPAAAAAAGEAAGGDATALAVRDAAAPPGVAAIPKKSGAVGFTVAGDDDDDAASMGNSAAWMKLLMEAVKEPMPGAREKFEQIVAAFPTAATYWKPYLEKEMAEGAGKVGPLFERCLRQCCSKELWRLYLRYVKQGAAAGQNARDELKTAYAFVAQHYGMDIGAAWFWHEYIGFIKRVRNKSRKKSAFRLESHTHERCCCLYSAG
jgi:hypothetical protein